VLACFIWVHLCLLCLNNLKDKKDKKVLLFLWCQLCCIFLFQRCHCEVIFLSSTKHLRSSSFLCFFHKILLFFFFFHFCVVEIIFFHYVFNLCLVSNNVFLFVLCNVVKVFVLHFFGCQLLRYYGVFSCVDVANVPTITFVKCIEVIPFFLPFVYLFQFDFVQYPLLMNQIWKNIVLMF
jgi:hypothetical protein